MTSLSSLTVSALSLDREDSADAAWLPLLQAAVGQKSRLVVLPFGFPKLKPDAAHRLCSRLARKHRIHLIAGWKEARKHLVRIYAPSGRTAGEYIQTHKLPGETHSLGGSLAPISTSLGKIGLSLGSDLYFPEIHWSQVQQGADLLVHLDIDRGVQDHFYSVLSPKARALDCHRPFLIARPSSRALKLAPNEELEMAGTPMSGSVIIDLNSAVLASTGFSQGVATASLQTHQHCRSLETRTNLPLSRGLDIWKLYFNDSRAKHFGPLRRAFSPPPKPRYKKRRIKIAVLSHHMSHQLGRDDAVLLRLLREACQQRPDIVVCTEMEQEAQPDSPRVAAKLRKMAETCGKVGSYLLIGGIRASKPGSLQDRASHAWLWDRKGQLVFESVIMLYGKGCGQEVYDADFGRLGIRLCGDVYAPELDRLFALQGADIVFNPSMSWGASGLINSELAQARAMDNGHYIVNAHLAFSDAGQRSQIIDPMGGIVAASAYYDNSVLTAEIDLDSKRGIFVPDGRRKVNPRAYLAGYRSRVTHTLLPQTELLKFRRPELYHLLDADLPDHPYTTRDRGDGCKVATPLPL